MTGLGRRSAVFDVALALAVTGAELGLLLDDGAASLGAILITVAAGATLALRRRAPVAVLAAMLAAAVALVVAGEASSGIGVLIALYTAAAICERSVSLAALLPTAVVVTALSIATAAAGDNPVVLSAVAAAPLAGGSWALGAYTQTRRRYTRALEERAAQLEREREQLARIAIQEERTAIARELHDIVAHSVGVMLLGVRGARDVIDTAPDVARDTLGRVEGSGEQSLRELRRILAVLRGPEQAAESRPQPSLADLDELVSGYQAAGLPVRLDVVGERPPLPGGLELSVYRIVQEALTNAIKHGDPTSVIVTLSFRAGRLELEVLDDGAPVAPASARERGGQGLVGMRERVAVLGGELEAGRRISGGFRVTARLPLGGDA